MAVEDCKTIDKVLKEKSNINVQFELDDDKPAQSDMTVVRFNGIDHQGHETFNLPRVFNPRSYDNKDDKGRHFSFCKTAEKPYDLLVCCCLIIFSKYFPKDSDFGVSSDGEREDWQPAADKCQEVLGYGFVIPQGV